MAPEAIQPWKRPQMPPWRCGRAAQASRALCYNEDGRWKRGATVAMCYENYSDLQAQIFDSEHIFAESRNRWHGGLSNQTILMMILTNRK